MNIRELETRRLELVARTAVQRVEMRRHLDGLHWRGSVSTALVALRVATFVAKWWTVGRTAWRVAGAMRRK
jgi:hypothetical protein